MAEPRERHVTDSTASSTEDLGEVKRVAPGVISFQIGGYVRLAAIEQVIVAANAEIRLGRRVSLFLDGYTAVGYDGEGRKLFQTWALGNRDDIEGIWVLFSSPLIKMGASLVGAFTGASVVSLTDRHKFEQLLAHACA